MKIKRYLFILLSLIYMDLIFNIFAYDSYTLSSSINIVLFAIINSFLISLLTGIFKDKVNKIMTYIIFIFMWFWYSFHCVFYRAFITPFSLTLFRQSDQTLKFAKNIIITILQNSYIILLFLVPVILLLIYRKKMEFKRFKLKNTIGWIGLLILSIGIYVLNIFVQDRGIGSAYNLYMEANNVSLNIEKLGVSAATYLDVYRLFTGIKEKIWVVEEIDDGIGEYNRQELNLDFGTGDIKTINDYMKRETGSKKNQYTGLFEGKNLIFIVAESFSEIAVDEELTPTLYKLVHEGFYFENFYTSNNISTIGGEFQALTGLYADNTTLTSWRGGLASYPYGLGNVFKKLGYNVNAYHDHDAYYQDRNVYLKGLGFDNYKGCNNGLEELINCNQFPESDIEMIRATVNDYLFDEEPFLTYYMTVSGHFYYNFSENAIARKNRELVDNLNYPEEVKGYIASQMELDSSLELLLKKLEEASKLDDTVIVLLADHYPYGLPINQINMLSDYERDSLIEANSNSLIIYNSQIESEKISKVGMSIDVIPTVYNLFGIDYDSRLFMGKDILSTNEGIAIFKDRSWITDKGTYYAATSKFESKIGEVDSEYIDRINKIVSNRLAISRMIVDNNYYKYVYEE